MTAVLEAGAAGVNIEDRRDGSGRYEPAEQAGRLAAARAATELLTSGTYDSVAGGIAYDTMNDAITAGDL